VRTTAHVLQALIAHNPGDALIPDAIRWLLSLRRPGVWAILPRLAGRSRVEPLLAVYEPMIRPAVERLAREGDFRLQGLVGLPHVVTPEVPADLEDCFRNVNTPRQWRAIRPGDDRD